MIPPPPRPRCFEFCIAWSTLFKLASFGLLIAACARLLPLFGMLLLAILIAITLWPVTAFVLRRGGPRWLGVALPAAIVLGAVGALLVVVSPVAASQVNSLIKELPTFKDHILHVLPDQGAVHDLSETIFRNPAFTDPAPLLKRFMDWGMTAATGLLEFAIILVIAIYLLADGQRVYEWLVAFLPPRHRERAAIASGEIFTVIFSYMGGQLITSLICAVYSWGVLTFLHVPNAVLLALVAGVFDILPIIGFFISLAPAVASALTISPVAASSVAALYLLFHLVENYYLVPAIYGNRLRLSTLTVLIACLAAGLLAGAIGIIVALPIVASFPVIERIWLRPVLGNDTVNRHDEIEQQEHPPA